MRGGKWDDKYKPLLFCMLRKTKEANEVSWQKFSKKQCKILDKRRYRCKIVVSGGCCLPPVLGMGNSQREKKQLEMAFPFLTWDSDTAVFPPHWHDCFEILYVSKGRVYVSIDDTVREAVAGDLVMVNSGAVHGYFDELSGTTIQGMQFDMGFFGEEFVNVREIVFHNPVIDKSMIQDAVYAHLCSLIREITCEYRKKALGYQLAIKSKVYELVLVILRESPRLPLAPLEISLSRVKQIRAFMYKNFDNPDLTLEDAASMFSLNKFYFIRFFKKHTGYSFHAYLVKTRVEFACRYLIESEMTITDIAFRSGFNSLQTFNRVFKSMTGFTPRDYRRDCSRTPVAGFGNNYDILPKRRF
jgi:AraC-like DNA-binding protein/mannose-6-phosphate isomerase-like protein (cupin superfamily)